MHKHYKLASILFTIVTTVWFVHLPMIAAKQTESLFLSGTEMFIPEPNPIPSQEVEQFDLINVLTWVPVEDPDPYHVIVQYNIYCSSSDGSSCSDATLIAELPQPQYPSELVVFKHHCRCPGQEYYYCVTAVDSLGNHSNPAQVTVLPSLIDIPAPTNVSTSQKITQFDLTNKICWEPVETAYYPVVGYNIYCIPHQENPYDCQNCNNCQPTCCTAPCNHATLLAQIAANEPLTFEHHYRCPGVIYDYCISTIAQTGESTTSSIIPKHVSVEPTIDPTTMCTCIDCQSLSLVDHQSHGAPVQSVAWLCDPCIFGHECSCTAHYIIPHPIAAIGGYLSYINACDGASVRVYALNFMTDQLIETAHAVPTSFVYSVDWCCIDGAAYLAVGGRPNELTGSDVWVYKYTFDGTTGHLELIDSFAHGATVWAVSWLCYDCKNNHTRYLAIGGDPSHNVDIRLLSFDSSLRKLSLTTNRTHGAPVYALDWCVRPSRNPLLLAGGKVAQENCKNYNFRIYSVACGGSMNLFSSGSYCEKTIRTVKWYCIDDRTCSTLPYFAVAGDIDTECCTQTEKYANVELYILNPLTHQVRPIAYTQQQARVFSVDWNPGCKSALITVGSGCKAACSCDPNIGVYELSKLPPRNLRYKASSRFDDSITSLKWCKFSNCSYLLAGAEHNSCNVCPIDPFCTPSHDIALYKSKLCTDALCPPTGICERRTSTSFQAE